MASNEPTDKVLLHLNNPTFQANLFGLQKPKRHVGLDTAKPYVSIYFAWNTARLQAGLADVRMHDLRHSFASLLINSGRTLYEVQHILGHTQIKTTQRYAHLSQDTLLAAANSATTALGSAMLSPDRMAPVAAVPAAL